jgi:hypothetical protein
LTEVHDVIGMNTTSNLSSNRTFLFSTAHYPDTFRTTMETLRYVHKRNIRPKGSFPSINDYEIILVKSVRAHRKPKKDLMSLYRKVRNWKHHFTQSKVRMMRKNTNNRSHFKSLDRTPCSSRDDDVREDEISLLDYVDGTVEV